jgi:hypothetical protein
MVRYSVMGCHSDLLGSASCSGSFVGVHASSAGGRETPVRTEPRPTILNDALCFEQILLVVVVVLVLDLLWGAPTMVLSLLLIGHHQIQLAASSSLIQIGSMKTKKLIHTNFNRGLLLAVPLICSMAFAACSDVAGRSGTRQAVNLQSAVVGQAKTRDYVTIGSRTYNTEARSFDRPWPFGPESSAQ